MKVNKLAYTQVARDINHALKTYDDDDFKPRVSVVNTAQHGYGFDKWSLSVDDILFDLIQHKGLAQNLFYADEVYTVTEPSGKDYDLYIEPVNRCMFSLAVL